MTFAGILIVESLHDGASLEPPSFTVRRIWRTEAGQPSAGQPLIWTFLEFEIPDVVVDAIIDRLRTALAPGPWYCDFRSNDETVVVFADRAFRYSRGDDNAYGSVREYARSVGVPESQIDWPV